MYKNTFYLCIMSKELSSYFTQCLQFENHSIILVIEFQLFLLKQNKVNKIILNKLSVFFVNVNSQLFLEDNAKNSSYTFFEQG